MAFQLSPGINTAEIDLTTVVPAVSTTTGAFAGVFAWGPTSDPVLVSSEVDLVNRFGKPIDGFNIETFYSAADFLAYGNSLFVQRVATGVKATGGANTSVQDFVRAKYEGEYGNSLKVIIVGKTAYANSVVVNITQRAPSTNTNYHMVVMDEDGVFSGVAGTVLEVFEDLSSVAGSKTEDGTNNYASDAINARSKYIMIDEAIETFPSILAPTPATTFISESLVGGTNGSNEANVAIADLSSAYDKFSSPEDIDISLIVAGTARGTDGVQLANYIIDNIAEVRKDCMVFISPEKADVVNTTTALSSVVAFSGLIRPSSYAVVDSGYKYRYDRYNDKYIYTPLNGDIAGLCVRTDEVRDPWFSPAGYNRGSIKNIIKLAYNPKKADRDQLYKADVNPVITQVGQGTVLFGDKTHLGRPSAFDRINVRRLFIVLEKAITRASKSTMFEFNDEFTRAQFKNLIEPFLRDVQGRRGIYDFKVVCDETNNTPEVIDGNRFVGDIYIKPARAINYIQLNFIAVRTGVEFEEIVGQR